MVMQELEDSSSGLGHDTANVSEAILMEAQSQPSLPSTHLLQLNIAGADVATQELEDPFSGLVAR